MTTAPAEPRSWRIRRYNKTKGVYFAIETGRDDTRASISLGYVGDDQAERALATMQREERTTLGTERFGRIERLHDTDPAAAVRILLDDAVVDEVFGPEQINYGVMLLRDYQRDVFGPARKAAKPKSWHQESEHWRRVNRGIGDTRLEDIDEFVVADWLDELVCEQGPRKGKPLGYNSKRLYRNSVGYCLKHAYRHRHIAKLPNLAIFELEGGKVWKKPDPLSIQDVVAIMEKSDPMHRAMWAVGAGLGLRPSELVRLDWSDVRWETSTLFLRGDVEGQGKTEASVDEIPMTPFARRELLRWWVRSSQPPAGLVFFVNRRLKPTGEVGPAPIGSYKTAFESACEAANVVRSRIYPYLLRDSFATIAWTLGIEKDVTRRIGRWTDMTMLDQVYCRPRPADLVARLKDFDVAV